MSTVNVKLYPALIPPKKKKKRFRREKKLSWLTLINENTLEEADRFVWESQRKMDWMSGKSCCSSAAEGGGGDARRELP